MDLSVEVNGKHRDPEYRTWNFDLCRKGFYQPKQVQGLSHMLRVLQLSGCLQRYRASKAVPEVCSSFMIGVKDILCKLLIECCFVIVL